MPPRPIRQMQVLDALRTEYERSAGAPELTALARSLGISYSTLREHLRALEAKGELILESRGPGRSPRLTLLGADFGVPLYGEIAAGLPVGAYPTPEGHLTLRGRPDQFALRVRGDSMADRIEDGDVVLLTRSEPHRPGEICAVRVGEDETTLKYLDWPTDELRPRKFRLRPHNPAFPTVVVDARELHVDGVFRSLLRGDIVEDLIVEGSEPDVPTSRRS